MYFDGEYWIKEDGVKNTFSSFTRSNVENLLVKLAFGDLYEVRVRRQK